MTTTTIQQLPLATRTFECQLQGYPIHGSAWPIKNSQFHDYGVSLMLDGEPFTFKMIMTCIEPKKYNTNMVTHVRSGHKRFFRFADSLSAEDCFAQTLAICIEELVLLRSVKTPFREPHG